LSGTRYFSFLTLITNKQSYPIFILWLIINLNVIIIFMLQSLFFCEHDMIPKLRATDKYVVIKYHFSVI